MTVERIREAILAEAREEAEEIKTRAQERHDKRMKQAERDLRQEYDHRLETQKRQERQKAERQIMHRRSEHNLELLKKRNSILDRLFHRAGRSLAELPDEEYREVIRGWIETELPDDMAGDLLCNARDEERLAPLVEDLNDSRPDDARLELQPGERPETGGVLFKAEVFEIDLSIDTRVIALRDDLAPRIAEMVFPSDATV